MRTDRTLKGVLLAFASFAAYSWSDASVKMIEGALTPYEMGFFGAVFMLAGFPYLMKPGDSWLDVVRSTNRPLWVLRFFSAAVGTIGSVAAFTYLSMAEAFALIFLLPSFVTIMSVLFLKETVGIRRWSAVIIGFVGVLVILRPVSASFRSGMSARFLPDFPGRSRSSSIAPSGHRRSTSRSTAPASRWFRPVRACISRAPISSRSGRRARQSELAHLEPGVKSMLDDFPGGQRH